MKQFLGTCCILLLMAGCDNSSAEKPIEVTPFPLDEAHIDTFKATVNKFEFERINAQGDLIDEFIAEQKFTQAIKSNFYNINWDPVKVLHNSWDTLRERREMILLDSAVNFY